jgi:two-component system sensor histidine kinase HydH
VAPPEAAESLRVLEDETARLDRMARSFSQFGRLPDGTTSDIDVEELLRATASACVPSHLQLSYEVDQGLPTLHGDHDALQRALMNVLLNAVDACGNSGHIRLSAHRDNGNVRIAVQDSGVGIAPDQLPGIFTPYVTHKPGGTGLGLAIAEQTVGAHGGRVSAESTPGHGTTIRFDLPVPGPAAPGAPH